LPLGVTLSAPTAAPRDAPSGAPLGDLHARTALVALALVREAPGMGGGATLLRALRERPGADAAGLLADGDADARSLEQGAIALCAQQPDRASWIVPTIVEQFPAALSLQEDGVAWALLPARAADEAGRATTAAARRVATRLGTRTAVGLSPFVTGPERLHDALRQARIVLELTRGGEVDVEQATTGTWRVLLAMALHDPAELAACVATSIGPALDHDARLRTEVVPTFRAYLLHDANMNATAAAIYAHRHTVAARLERLAALTRLDPTRHDDRERLGVGLKAHAILRAISH
jgi:DNA-binding PucR family transcriptional regulator